ncbi:m049R [Myxoma virus]|uniref:M049R n=1 Tax=Myxoma virus TaxID=10273 RepID=A0A4P8ETZ7_9POXV|nr:m049R [Myxoma virus]QDP38515.1 m049 [Myxoma virus]
MGIKNLKTLLLKTGTLTQIDEIEKDDVREIFVDTMSFFVSIAYSVNNLTELYNNFLHHVQAWKTMGKVTLFVDRGDIFIKDVVREKRKRATQQTIKRKQMEIEQLRDFESFLGMEDALYEEKKTDIELRINKLMFHIFLANNNQLKTTLEHALTMLDDVTILYCNGMDAEFVLCLNAKKLADEQGTWPLMISTDQDLLLFSSCDESKKIIRTINGLYSFIPCATTRYLSRLVTLVNGCDYFPGLYGYCVTEKTLESIELFEEFTVEHVVQSLVIKNFTNKTNKMVDVDGMIRFVDRYAELDDSVYDERFDCVVTAQEFIFAALADRCMRLDDVRHCSVISALVCVLDPRQEITETGLRVVHALALKPAKKVTEEDIATVVSIFGYRTRVTTNALYGVLNLKTLLLAYNDAFYFNSEIIIKNIAKNDIINIG